MQTVENENILGDAAMTVLIGLVVVFGVLLILTFVIWLFGKIVGSGKSSASSKPTAASGASASSAAAAKAPVVEDSIPEEVVAVIAAAVAAMSEGATRYAVRRISAARTPGLHSAWAAAGLSENTQPF